MATVDASEGADRRSLLLAKIVDYVLENGIADLTLRRLAAAVGSNNRMLLYYFGSREELITTALEAAGSRFPGLQLVMDSLDDRTRPLEGRLLDAWAAIADPANLPFHRLFFEIFGMAGFERRRFAKLLTTVGTEWVIHAADAFVAAGVPAERAEIFAHELVALWRGLQATLISNPDSTHTASLVDRAAHDSTLALLDRAGVKGLFRR